MKSNFFFPLLAGLCFIATWRSEAAQITCQGVLGNSGEQGPTLARFGAPPLPGMGIVYDGASGSLWTRCGDGVLNRYALDGRLLATYPIIKTVPHPMTLSHRDHLTRAGDKIILDLAGKLYALPIDATSGTAATPLNINANLMSASSVNGSVAIATTTDNKSWQAALFNAETGTTTPVTTNLPANVRQIELMPDGDVVIHIQGTTLGDAHINGIHELHLFHNGQEVTDGWPRPSPGENMQFLDNSWYGAAYNGTIRRFNANLEADPGVVLGGGSGAFIGHVESNQEVGTPCGLAKIRDGLFAVTGSSGIIHLLEWDKTRLQFSIVRRIGAIQACHGLALNHQGDVWYESGLWHWNDPPDSPQHEGTIGLEMGQAVMLSNDRFTAPILHGNVPWVMGEGFTSYISGNDLLRETGPPTGFLNGSAVYKDDKNALLLLAIDSKGNSRSYRIDFYTGRSLEIRGQVVLETVSPVKEWTSLAMKDPDTLLGAGDGFVIEMARDGVNWKETRRWNTAPDGTFGSHIYLTADAGRLWVSDTDNHRVLGFKLANETFLASFGKKGEQGNDLTHLDSPGVLEARDNRVIVFDTGNQRLMKLFFSE